MEEQALHVAVHHKFDPAQDYDNTRDNDLSRLHKFETADEVASQCALAHDENAWVYVHRCRPDPYKPTVTSRGKVAEIIRSTGRPSVVLDDLEAIDKGALHKPPQGHNYYYAPLPSWR